jgi:hypothetical protein
MLWIGVSIAREADGRLSLLGYVPSPIDPSKKVHETNSRHNATETGDRKHSNQVYIWNGERMSESAASALDKEILSAMAARDDACSWNQCVMYRSIRDVYFLLLTIITVGVMLFVSVRRLMRR